MSEAMAAWGYEYVETPLVERASTFEAVSGEPLDASAFRLFDTEGDLLVLRPEMTVPIARLSATRLQAEAGPYRLRYAGRVVRDADALSAQPREFTQVGLELVGTNGASSDAEIIGAMVETLSHAGLSRFTVGVGTVAVLRAVIDAAGMPADWQRRVLDAAHDRNLVGIDELALLEGVPEDVARALSEVPRTRGGLDAISRCRDVAGRWAGEALDELQETWELIRAMGAENLVSIDFGIMRSFDYYTGVVIEAYAEGAGVPLGGGGRYDDVLETFGAGAPAAGFAIRLERLHEALAAQETSIPVRVLDAILIGDDAAAFDAAGALRGRGWRVRLAGRVRVEEAEDAARAARATWALVADDGRVSRVEGGRLVPLDEDVPPPSSLRVTGGDLDV
jgi:ATP phosphoribosyltransferase regulatory subunit